MINIYNLKYGDEVEKFQLTCHTDVYYGTSKELFYRRGVKYWAEIEIIKPSKDTKYKPCTLIWISYDGRRGGRFSVDGNIYTSESPRWSSFRNHFNCPLAEQREENIDKILQD